MTEIRNGHNTMERASAEDGFQLNHAFISLREPMRIPADFKGTISHNHFVTPAGTSCVPGVFRRPALKRFAPTVARALLARRYWHWLGQ